MTKRERRTYTEEFKEQMIKLYVSGKPKKDIISEYDLTSTAFNTWIKRSQSTGSFKEKDNRSPEENELIKVDRGSEFKNKIIDEVLDTLKIGPQLWY